MMRDIKSNLDVVQSLAPAARTAGANGTGVDLLGFGGAMILVDLGLFTDGSFSFHLEESDDNSTFTDVDTSVDQLGSLTVVDGTDDDNTLQRVGYIGSKRYVRVVVAQGGSPCGTGLVCGAHVVRGYPSVKPLA